MQTHRHLVAGTDFSSGSEQAIETAIRLAAACATPTRLVLVHVCELGVHDLDEERLARCGEALNRAIARYRRDGIDVSGVLRSGAPPEKLDNVAVDFGASLIVVGRHGGGRGPRVAIGSVAERLVRSASRPVLTVPCALDRLGVEA